MGHRWLCPHPVSPTLAGCPAAAAGQQGAAAPRRWAAVPCHPAGRHQTHRGPLFERSSTRSQTPVGREAQGATRERFMQAGARQSGAPGAGASGVRSGRRRRLSAAVLLAGPRALAAVWNDFTVLPSDLPSSGSLAGPKASAATPPMTTSSGKPSPKRPATTSDDPPPPCRRAGVAR